VTGELVPTGGLLAVSAPSAGVISQCLVREGSHVRAGEAVAELRTEVSSLALGDTRAAIGAQLDAQRRRLQDDLDAQAPLLASRLQELDAQLASLRRQLDLLESMRALRERHSRSAQALLESLRPLRDKGVLGVFEFQEREAAALEAQGALQQAEISRLELQRQARGLEEQRARAPLDAQAQRREIERKLADLDQAAARNEAERSVVLHAPRAGTVSALAGAVGQSVAAGQRLMNVVPEGSLLQAQLWLPGSAIGEIGAGDGVVLRYHAFPYQKFGEQRGRVVDVSGSALAPADVARLSGRSVAQPLYRVLVQLERQQLTLGDAQLPLKASMDLDADVLLERRRLIEWILAPLWPAAALPQSAAGTAR
jgi:membrane fusion protein